MRKTARIIGALLALGIGACGAEGGVDDPAGPAADTSLDEPMEIGDEQIIATFRAMGIDESEIVIDGDRVVVQEDIVLDREDLLARIRDHKIEKGYFCDDGVSDCLDFFTPVDTAKALHINVKFSSGVSSAWRTAFEHAAARWSQISIAGTRTRINMTFESPYDTNFSGTEPKIQIKNAALGCDSSSCPWARADFPRNSGGAVLPGAWIEINSDFTGSVSVAQQRKIATHELGHTLGFMHPGVGQQIGFTGAASDNYDSVMWQGTIGGKIASFLSTDDKASAWWTYYKSECDTFDPSAPDAAFCDATTCRCGFGHGDCDSDAQCAPGLECGLNNGADYGLPSSYEVCVAPSACADFDPSSPSASFCSNLDCPCGVNEGDCDNDDECGGELICGKDNGPGVGLGSTYDVCVPPPAYGCPTYSTSSWSWSFCTPDCPCALGQGDCDTDADCKANLVCGQNVGDAFGMSSDRDLCVHPTLF